MDCVNEEKRTETNKRSYRHNEYKHNALLNENITGEIAALSTYDIQGKSSRFTDPYIEYVYSSKSPNTKHKTVGDLLNPNEPHNTTQTTDTSENIEKHRYDDKFYSKVYRNPILNKREKLNTKKDEPDQSKSCSQLTSSYDDAYNDGKYFSLLNNRFSNSSINPIFKGPAIRQENESFTEMKTRKFYTSTYNKCYDSNEKLEMSTPISLDCNSNNSKMKLKPLNGNLIESNFQGKYFDRDRNSKLYSRLKCQMDSIIYPFKN